MALTQKSMIEEIQAKLQAAGISIGKPLIQTVLEAHGEVITQSLQSCQEAPLIGLGKLKPTVRAARTGRNPQTGESMELPARNTVKFSEAQTLKAALNG